MTRYSKLNFVYRLQKWMDSVPGQTFLNYAYSWGASLVILGALFKLNHLPGASIMLYIGMGTEVIVFFISAFDRPFDKTAIGMDLPTHIYPENEEEDEEHADVATDNACDVQRQGQPATIIIGGGGTAGGGVVAGVPEGGLYEQPDGQSVAAVAGQPVDIPQPVVPEMAEAAGAYVEELKKLTEVLQKVSEQSQRLTTDSEEMENLNRTLTGICKIYEMQLKSASSQIGTIDEINAQTRKMADQIEQLNTIYTRMIEAMTVNMRAAGAAPQQ